MPEKIRSFIAFDIDNDVVLRRFSEVQGILINTGADLKLVKPQNIHITMRFLGDISMQMIDPIHDTMKEIFSTPFDVYIRGVGEFPNPKRIRVVWAGIRSGAENLKDVFEQLEPRLRRLGFKPDFKGFNPHITLTRVRTSRHKTELIQSVGNLVDYEFGIVRAKCLRLKKSVLTPRGPIYSTLREVCHLKEGKGEESFQ